ncbi:MAG: PIG-L deacetylase family protein [Limisphaerales bacterium]
MKVLCVHAHYDDFEFVAAGTFELWRRKLGAGLQARVVVCTDGCAGHQFRTRAETGRMRLREQEASARLGGYEFELLKLPDGSTPREGFLQVTPPLLAGLWKAIRDFDPDYLFCPPLPSDPLAGVHLDHLGVAEAVRQVAYLLNVPHAFTPEYPADETQPVAHKTPVIINAFDSYMAGGNACDIAVDVGEVFEKICEMSWCHQSQIAEWLPWVGRHDMVAPKSVAEWSNVLRRRFEQKNRQMGLASDRLLELFNVTAWGVVPSCEQILLDFPGILPEASNLDRLRQRLARYS